MAKETEKPTILALSALLGPFVLLLPPTPATCVPFDAIYPKPQRESPGAHECTCGGGEGRGREGDWQRWQWGQQELKNTSNTSPSKHTPEPLP